MSYKSRGGGMSGGWGKKCRQKQHWKEGGNSALGKTLFLFSPPTLFQSLPGNRIRTFTPIL